MRTLVKREQPPENWLDSLCTDAGFYICEKGKAWVKKQRSAADAWNSCNQFDWLLKALVAAGIYTDVNLVRVLFEIVDEMSFKRGGCLADIVNEDVSNAVKVIKDLIAGVITEDVFYSSMTKVNLGRQFSGYYSNIAHYLDNLFKPQGTFQFEYMYVYLSMLSGRDNAFISARLKEKTGNPFYTPDYQI